MGGPCAELGGEIGDPTTVDFGKGRGATNLGNGDGLGGLVRTLGGLGGLGHGSFPLWKFSYTGITAMPYTLNVKCNLWETEH